MTARLRYARLLVSAALLICAGCSHSSDSFHRDDRSRYFRQIATEIEYPDTQTPLREEAAASLAPRSITEPGSQEIWELTLEDAIATALSRSEAVRDLGGRVLASPASMTSIYDPSLVETNPRLGVEAALAAFDASLNASLFWARNDRAVNNDFTGTGSPLLVQDTGDFTAEISKRAATGTLFAIRNITNYEWNNSPAAIRRFPSFWDTMFETEIRQPLLQGAGVEFNRIAGPNASPGSFFFTNGVLLARVNTDISLTEFEQGIRNLVSDVENAYWDLYFAYRDLDAKISARDEALDTWRRQEALFEQGAVEAYREAQAREQYFSFQSQVQNALNGTPGTGTSSGSGSSGGIFRGSGGVYVAERRLRFVCGLPANDGRLIRPADELSKVKVVYDWEQLLAEALSRRVELRRQRWTLRRYELELVATRNFLLPRLDAVGLYRWRGLGDDLLNPTRQPSEFNNAFQNLTGGNFQEWQLGLQLQVPIGYRKALSGVRNAQLRIARERAVLHEIELKVSHDLADSVSEMQRAYAVAMTNFNRRVAAARQLSALEALREQDLEPDLDQLLDAQRRNAEADINYYRSLIEYNLAIKNVHFEKGSLLEYNGVYLSEGPWPKQAYDDAYQLSRKFSPKLINYCYPGTNFVSSGTYDQLTETGMDYRTSEPPPLPPAAQPQQPMPLPEGQDLPPPPNSREAFRNGLPALQ